MKAWARCFDIGAAIPGANPTPEEYHLLLANFTAVTPVNCVKPGPVCRPKQALFLVMAVAQSEQPPQPSGPTWAP
jgi:hypothetical protein